MRHSYQFLPGAIENNTIPLFPESRSFANIVVTSMPPGCPSKTCHQIACLEVHITNEISVKLNEFTTKQFISDFISLNLTLKSKLKLVGKSHLQFKFYTTRWYSKQHSG